MAEHLASICRLLAKARDLSITWVMPSSPPPPAALMSVMGGGIADWSAGASQTIYTAPSNINGMLVTRIVGRSYTGTQPVTIQLKVAGTNWGAAITVVSLVANSAFILPMTTGLAPVVSAGKIIEVVPSLASAGTMTFDVNGYFF